MGINPLGSNKKARTTLIFNKDVERLEFKNALSDIATARNISPSEAALALVLEHVASTAKARDIARTMYAYEYPRCLDGLEIIFQDLAAQGEAGRDSKPVLTNFLELALDFGLSINTNDDDAIYLVEQWHSIIDVLESASKNKEPEAMLAARDASQLGTTLEDPCAMQIISPLLSCLLKNWDVLRTQSSTYRTLCCFARMAFPTRKGLEETAETRLAFMRTADEFYASGKEGGL
ncbi:MAG: hypothetical protein DUD39_11485 [Coriobacteriaceae bacterium]|nr:MAG: hypothetical protein DUD39_11485 [Coriobacteriaceae bacterium]